MDRQLTLIETPQDSSPTTPGDIENAVSSTLSELKEHGLLGGKYTAVAATLRHTARAVDRGLSYGGKISVATAQLTKQLFEALDKLPDLPADTSNVFDTLDTTIETLTKEALQA